MNIAFKYRSNIFDKEKGYRQDTKSLLDGIFYAPLFKQLNDPFEASVELPNHPDHDHWVTPLKQNIYGVGVYSLVKPKEGELFPSNELMWAHYANSHQGFCIEYDLDILKDNLTKDFDIRNYIHVEYANESPVITEGEDIFSIQRKVFGTKSIPWEYESEIRLVFEKGGIKPIANDAIKSIYFGLNIGFNEWKAIIDSLKGKGIDFYQIVRVGKSYKLSCVKLDFDLTYQIISTRHNRNVENYTILYNSQNKDKNSMSSFVKQLRVEYNHLANFTIIDDLRTDQILNDYKPRNLMSNEEIEMMSEHWIAYSSFDAPDVVFMYPEK